METLKKYGYKGSYLSKDWLKQPVFIQSFAPTSLVYISTLTELPKILLIDDVTIPTQDTNQVRNLAVFTASISFEPNSQSYVTSGCIYEFGTKLKCVR